MKKLIHRWCLTSWLLMLTLSASAQQFVSPVEQTELIELYTSEGCSSCPPADKWISNLSRHTGLFKRFIPLSFHVDYWNDLGWQDRFSSQAYSKRQLMHQIAGNLSQVYTPAIVANNQEWRAWRFSRFLNLPDSHKPVGRLKVNVNHASGELEISFKPQQPLADKQVILNVAILGCGLSSNVQQGENQGRRLHHDFVVLKHIEAVAPINNVDVQQWQMPIPVYGNFGQTQNALVVWLSDVNTQHSIQATGGYL